MDKGWVDTYFAGMPDPIDLGPHEYSRFDKRSGKMVRDYSPKFMRNMTFVAIGLLAFIFFTRDTGTRDMLFAETGLFAFFGGITAANWLKNIY